MKLPVALAALAISALTIFAQKMQTPAGEAPGPWLLGTIGVGKQPDGTVKTTALKGLAIKVGEHGEAAVCYDLDLCRMAGAWTGGKFTTPINLMSRGEYPTALGDVAFTTDEVAGFWEGEAPPEPPPAADDRGSGGASPSHSKDPRPESFGPLPPNQARFKGFYVHGEKTILKWEIGGTEVLEMPQFHVAGDLSFFSRSFQIGAHAQPITVLLASLEADKSERIVTNGAQYLGQISSADEGRNAFGYRHFGNAATANPGSQKGSESEQKLTLLPSNESSWLVVAMEAGSRAIVRQTLGQLPSIRRPDLGWLLNEIGPGIGRLPIRELPVGKAIIYSPNLQFLTRGGPARWPEPVITQGKLATDSAAAYVVDTIKLPDSNPWGAPMFIGGFDFFPDGHAAVCTFHGDVFLVSGIDEKLERVTWKRFASGLYHALGLKIVNGEIFVACRDGIWRLKDLNGDGECDFYEAFNFDVKVTKNFHEFVFDLQTDAAGNFYFAKAGPVKNGGRGFDEIMSQHGTLMRVSPNGAKLDVIATGLRAPNGIGVGPRGELTSGDNEGTWTPAGKINWIKPGGFYGVVDLAQRTPPPTAYDPPLCWLPKRVDNSGGSQVWVPDNDRWGPWRGKMLHLSYGQSALYGVLAEQIPNSEFKIQNSAMQGGVTKFPLQFESGIMRARFNPKDGQLYVAGLRGWQTTGLKNGCFQRVRFTGAVPRMPVEMHIKKHGIELRFACSLDTQSASDPENWHLEQWRYLWSSAYGSPEFSTEGDIATAEKKHDPVLVKSVSIGTDDRSVFLEIPALKPVMQMSIRYDLKTADGEELRGEVVTTIHALGAE